MLVEGGLLMESSLNEKTQVVKKRGFSGSTLKIIAVICMLIDHIAAILILMGIFYKVIPCKNINPNISGIYFFMRAIGRVCFPIFCFLLVEGYVHTSDKKKYALRMFIFALISEIPFNLAFANKAILPASRLNNVFFTLFLGIVLMYFQIGRAHV